MYIERIKNSMIIKKVIILLLKLKKLGVRAIIMVLKGVLKSLNKLRKKTTRLLKSLDERGTLSREIHRLKEQTCKKVGQGHSTSQFEKSSKLGSASLSIYNCIIYYINLSKENCLKLSLTFLNMYTHNYNHDRIGMICIIISGIILSKMLYVRIKEEKVSTEEIHKRKKTKKKKNFVRKELGKKSILLSGIRNFINKVSLTINKCYNKSLITFYVSYWLTKKLARGRIKGAILVIIGTINITIILMYKPLMKYNSVSKLGFNKTNQQFDNPTPITGTKKVCIEYLKNSDSVNHTNLTPIKSKHMNKALKEQRRSARLTTKSSENKSDGEEESCSGKAEEATVISERTGLPKRKYKRRSGTENSKKLKTTKESSTIATTCERHIEAFEITTGTQLRDEQNQIKASSIMKSSGMQKSTTTADQQQQVEKTLAAQSTTNITTTNNSTAILNSNKPNNKNNKITIPEENQEDIDISSYETETEGSENSDTTYEEEKSELGSEMEVAEMDTTNRPMLQAKRLKRRKNETEPISQETTYRKLSEQEISHRPQFRIEYNTNDTVNMLKFMYGSAYLNETDKCKVETVISKVNSKTILTSDELESMKKCETEINQIISEQFNMLEETEIYARENILNSDALNQIAIIRNNYLENKIIDIESMNVLKQHNEIASSARLIRAQKAILHEMITYNKLETQAVNTARALAKKLDDNQLLTQGESVEIDQMIKRQNELLEIDNQKGVLNRALAVESFAVNHKNEISKIIEANNQGELVDRKRLNSLINWTNKSELDETTSTYFASIKRMLMDNEEYEIKYPRKRFTASLRGKGINSFPNTFDDRLKELKRCKPNIKTTVRMDLLREMTPGEEYLSDAELLIKIKMDKNEAREIHIEVTTYKELQELLTPWPFDAFGKGVIPHLEPIKELPIIFNDMDKHISFKKDSLSSKKLEQEYGIVQMERIYVKNNLENPSRSVRTKVVTIKSYIESMLKGVPISSAFRIAIAQINYAKVCMTCGSLKHFKCEAMTRCLRCESFDHTTDRCTSMERCINCKRNHRCDSEECELLRRKTYAANDYAISVLLGERIISHISKILRDPESERRSEVNNKEELEIIVSELITKNAAIQVINDRQLANQKEISAIQGQLVELKETDARIIESVDIVKTELKGVKESLDSSKKELKEEIIQSKAEMCSKQDETNRKITELINVFSKISSPVKRKKRSDKD